MVKFNYKEFILVPFFSTRPGLKATENRGCKQKNYTNIKMDVEKMITLEK